VNEMFRAGLLDEVKSLLQRGYGAKDPGLRGIGYRELLDMRRGCQTIQQVRRSIVGSTRRYAKRQLTFFRAVPGVSWVSPEGLAEVKTRIEAFLGASP
jgi:tRNA dimethylallyltransferase